jgi:hypothetical protein
MNMRKTFIVLFGVIISYSVYSGGASGATVLPSHFLQLRVTNLTESKIDIYVNTFRYPIFTFNAYETDYTNTEPINFDYPGFIAIDRGDGILEVYEFGSANPVRLHWMYSVIIYDNKVEFYRVDGVGSSGRSIRFREKIDLDTTLKDLEKIENQRDNNYRWIKYELNNINLTLEIENKSTHKIVVSCDELESASLENNTNVTYEINDSKFTLKFMRLRILHYEGINPDGGPFRNEEIILYNDWHKNIKVIFTASGYEVKYI